MNVYKNNARPADGTSEADSLHFTKGKNAKSLTISAVTVDNLTRRDVISLGDINYVPIKQSISAFIGGNIPDSAVLFMSVFDEATTLPSPAVGTVLFARTVSTTQNMVLHVKKAPSGNLNTGVTVATITFTQGAQSGTIDVPTEVVFSPGDAVIIESTIGLDGMSDLLIDIAAHSLIPLHPSWETVL